MNDLGKYGIQVDGRVNGNELNALSPLEISVERVDAESTWLTVLTDQSGLIGLLRHLHGLGFVLLRVDREE